MSICPSLSQDTTQFRSKYKKIEELMKNKPYQLENKELALVTAYKAVKKTHEEVASLFRTIDRIMEENGFLKDGKSNQFDFEKFNRYEDAKDFCPNWFEQNYLYKNDSKIVAYIAILPFGDDSDETSLGETPYISCECYIYKTKIRKGKAQEADVGSEEGYTEEIISTGFYNKKNYKSKNKPLLSSQIFSIRLLKIRDEKDVKKIIVSPLKMMADKAKPNSILSLVRNFKEHIIETGN
jgi:hypothetical protein